MICFITGGERSGKSRFAQTKALALTDTPVYLATARRWDADFIQRIQRHQHERDQRWINLEIEVHISDCGLHDRVIVLDCVTLWLTNIFADHQYDVEKSLLKAKAEFDKFANDSNTWLIISNEIGMGVHAATEIGRKFVELQGWMNQYIATKADEAFLMVSGIPMQIKSLKK